ncbi:sensor histidine kinase [Chitinimonas koreensis]|uniref:sensor histidine kinase n=1 Tax=Chitinimonas koreensis TaxID=356302 RepID=UPI0003FF028B|nr:ATP-binding protein [Chitinimonas koreensis]QNM97438.1 ATP-binding protein [Chitinimonas koreensis]
MGSDPAPAPARRLRLRVAIAALLLAGLAAIAAQQPGSPRGLAICALLAAAALVWGGQALLRLTAPQPIRADEPAFGLPTDLDACRAALLRLEALIEHAPVALWRAGAGEAQPLNAAARRVLAPGRASAPEAVLALLRQAHGGQRQLVGFDSERGHERAVLAAAALTLAGEEEKLLALMPIESELEAETLDAWRQLVHVLTHEIMNSLTPIASLSRTAQALVAEQPDADPDLAMALETIARRAAHLVEFVASYRSVSQLPAPKLEPVRLQPLFGRLRQWAAADWQARGGEASFTVEPATLELMADPDQLEQSLLNLVKNAADATRGLAAPRLAVTARLVRGGRLAIEVADNGPGVPAGLEARIFTPFFSTKDKGLGVGLALVRNQVHGMGGTVRYAKRASGGACFVLTF